MSFVEPVLLPGGLALIVGGKFAKRADLCCCGVPDDCSDIVTTFFYAQPPSESNGETGANRFIGPGTCPTWANVDSFGNGWGLTFYPGDRWELQAFRGFNLNAIYTSDSQTGEGRYDLTWTANPAFGYNLFIDIGTTP